MFKDCIRLLSVQLLDFFNFNELLYTKDNKRRNNGILFGVTFIILAVVLIGFCASSAYSLALLQLTELIPASILANTSIIILVFTIFKASGVLFGTKDYDMLMSFPIRKSTIIASRFLSMYIGNLVFTLLTMLPSVVVYVIFANPSPIFYLYIFISIVAIPLIPMTIASTIGVLITAVSARIKHKNIVSILLSIALIIAVFGISFFSKNNEPQQISDISKIMLEQINQVYPVAGIFTKAIVYSDFIAFVKFIGISLGIFIVFIAIVAWKYSWIMTALQSHRTKSNYILKEVLTSSPLKALYKKEIRRYFSSSIYVMNTGIGYIMLFIASVALLILGKDRVAEILQLPNVSDIIGQFAPLVIAAMISITSTTVCSISLEGKQWWIPLTMPVPTKLIFDSKILVNLTLSIPTSIITSTIVALTIDFNMVGYILLYVTPIVYCIFAAVVGITINAKLPQFNWNNEVVVVKQSIATLVGMIVGGISFIAPIIIIIVFKGINRQLIILIITGIIAGITIYLYKRNNRIDLRYIGER